MSDGGVSVPATHVVLPDTQVKAGVPTDHLRWIGRYIWDQFHDKPNVKIIHLGDHWDMPSLSSWDAPGSKDMEGRRYMEDVEAGNEGIICTSGCMKGMIPQAILDGDKLPI